MGIRRKWYTKRFTKENIDQVTNVSGVYLLMNRAKSVTYIGSSTNLKTRLIEYLRTGKIPNVHYFMCYQLSGKAEAKRVKAKMISQYQPYYN
ncbi:MAG: GIY-YIG nuclease family protein [Bacteroidales bacterium]|nr:GIY-YIG nuclease family protein [Bacteroidales bacterium]